MTPAAWLETYKASHQHPVNRACHSVGIPMIVLALPLLFFSWKGALGLFVLGWVLQFVGHWFEGKPPAFLSDARYLVVGPYWWVKKFFKRDR